MTISSYVPRKYGDCGAGRRGGDRRPGLGKDRSGAPQIAVLAGTLPLALAHSTVACAESAKTGISAALRVAIRAGRSVAQGRSSHRAHPLSPSCEEVLTNCPRGGVAGQSSRAANSCQPAQLARDLSRDRARGQAARAQTRGHTWRAVTTRALPELAASHTASAPAGRYPQPLPRLHLAAATNPCRSSPSQRYWQLGCRWR